MAAKTDALANKLANRNTNAVANSQPQTLKDWVQTMTPQIARALPSVITPERFTRIALTALSANPQLAQCERNSFLGALMQCAQLGLEPNTPTQQSYLIPFRNNRKGIVECQMQVGYKGLLQLAYRSNEITVIQSHIVYEKDEFEYELGLEAKLSHKPCMSGDRGEMVAVYAIYKTKSGGYGFEVMSKADIEKHRDKYSQAAKGYMSPWKSDFEAMAKKTVLKQALKYAPMSSEFVVASEVDNNIMHPTADYETVEIEYVNNDADEYDQEEREAIESE